jgi:hypothetical protein
MPFRADYSIDEPELPTAGTSSASIDSPSMTHRRVSARQAIAQLVGYNLTDIQVKGG